MKNRGFTLLETLVVIAIIGFVSVIGTYKFASFQKDSQLSAFSEEFASNIKTAKNKSINGEILPGQNVTNFKDPDGLPYWGVSTTTNSYSLTENCTLADNSPCTPEVETYNLPTGYTFETTGFTNFSRLSGQKSGTGSYILKTPGNNDCSKVLIDSSGEVSLSKIVCP